MSHPPAVSPPPGGGWDPPAPIDDESPPPRRRRSRRGALGALSVMLSLLLVLGFAGQTLLGEFDPPTPRPLPNPEPSPPPPDPGPESPWQLPQLDWEVLPIPSRGDAWAALQPEELLGEQPPILSRCPAVQSFATAEEYQELVRHQWHCVHTAWVPLLERKGWSTVEPAVEFFEGTGSSSECGHLEAPAFYCSAGSGTAHFGTGHMEMAMMWELSINEMVNHEYAHHVQSLAGITTAKLALDQSEETERRAELQATCWSAAMTYGNDAVDFDQDSWDSWQERLETTIIDGVHGSRESIVHWGTRGLYAEVLGDCNTWAVDAAMVT